MTDAAVTVAAGVRTASSVGRPVLSVCDLRASYGPYRALFGVSFDVPEDAIVALLGSNGAGKSTVARVVSGLVRATGGSVAFRGEDITRLPAHKIAGRGMAHVPEGRGVFASLGVEEQLVLAFRRSVGRKGVAEALGRAYEAFPVLSERRKQSAGTLSGGEQRMLSLARVLAVPPKLLIGDELALGLAPVVVDAVYEGLTRIRSMGASLLVVEQHVNRVMEIADQAVLLAKGSVAWAGPAADAHAATEQLLGAEALQTVPDG